MSHAKLAKKSVAPASTLRDTYAILNAVQRLKQRRFAANDGHRRGTSSTFSRAANHPEKLITWPTSEQEKKSRGVPGERHLAPLCASAPLREILRFILNDHAELSTRDRRSCWFRTEEVSRKGAEAQRRESHQPPRCVIRMRFSMQSNEWKQPGLAANDEHRRATSSTFSRATNHPEKLIIWPHQKKRTSRGVPEEQHLAPLCASAPLREILRFIQNDHAELTTRDRRSCWFRTEEASRKGAKLAKREVEMKHRGTENAEEPRPRTPPRAREANAIHVRTLIGRTESAGSGLLSDDLNPAPVGPFVMPVVGAILDRQRNDAAGEPGEVDFHVPPLVLGHSP